MNGYNSITWIRRATLGGALAIVVSVTGAIMPASDADAAVRGDAKLATSPSGDHGSQSIDNLDPATVAIMKRQDELNPAVTMLTEAAMEVPASGFASVGFENDGITLYWKGAVPRAKGIHSGGDGRCILFQGMNNVTSARTAWPGVTPYTG